MHKDHKVLFFFWDKKDMFCFVWVMLLSINVSFLLKYRPNVLTWKTSNLLSSTWKIVICWRLCLHLDWQIIAAKWNEMEWIGAYRKGRFPLTDFLVHQWPLRWYVMTRPWLDYFDMEQFLVVTDISLYHERETTRFPISIRIGILQILRSQETGHRHDPFGKTSPWSWVYAEIHVSKLYQT